MDITPDSAISIPDDVQALVEEFAALFEVPSDLPPPRSCVHSIPLVEGATQINMRLYRYALVLKDEIDRQVKEMMASGLIQPSSSPFSYSILLVKKKDNNWRFCVDYGFLNAITVKGKCHMPIIDEFLDELANSCWFTCLDLRAVPIKIEKIEVQLDFNIYPILDF
jgi:hypothetical protein